VWSKLFARAAIEGVMFEETRHAEDCLFTTKALCQADRIAYLDKILYNYVVNRPDSGMSQKRAEDLLDVDVQLFKKQMAFLRACGLHETADKAAYSFYRRALHWYIVFQKERRKPLVRRLVALLRAEQRAIKEIYRHPWVKTGDRARMRVFLFWPWLYYVFVKGYDRYVIPARIKKLASIEQKDL
jgi:hypothetical protein